MKSEQINELAEALAKAQLEIQGAEKESVNPFHKSKYADLHSVRQACREPMGKHGLSFVQITDTIADKLCLVTILMHKSGQWIKSILPIPITKGDAQSLGSSLTYCRRYALSAMVGVSVYDDDGEAATKHSREEEAKAVIEHLRTIEELAEALPSVGCFESKEVLKNFIKASIEKGGGKKTESEVIASAMRDAKMLEKFKIAMEKWQLEPPQ